MCDKKWERGGWCQMGVAKKVGLLVPETALYSTGAQPGTSQGCEKLESRAPSHSHQNISAAMSHRKAHVPEKEGMASRSLQGWVWNSWRGGVISGDDRRERGWPPRAGCLHSWVCPVRVAVAATSGCAPHEQGWPPRAGMAATSGNGRQERGWRLRAGCWDPLMCLVRVARPNGCSRCLCLVAKRHS